MCGFLVNVLGNVSVVSNSAGRVDEPPLSIRTAGGPSLSRRRPGVLEGRLLAHGWRAAAQHDVQGRVTSRSPFSARDSSDRGTASGSRAKKPPCRRKISEAASASRPTPSRGGVYHSQVRVLLVASGRAGGAPRIRPRRGEEDEPRFVFVSSRGYRVHTRPGTSVVLLTCSIPSGPQTTH